MQPSRGGGGPPASTSSRSGALRDTCQSHDEQQPAGEDKHSTTGATQAVVAKRIKARNRLSADNSGDLPKCAASSRSSSESSLAKGLQSELGGAKKSSHSHARFNGNKQGGTHTNTVSEDNHFSVRAAMQKPSRGIVYLGHIPSGFNEPQMLRFFSQFGEVVGVELRRSKKTRQSKGYGYVGFELPEVAEVVAETMNNYMMFGRTLCCQVVAPERVPRRLFRNWGKKFRRLSTRVRAVQQHNKPDDALPTLRQVKRRLEKERKIAERLTALGLEHAAPTVIGAVFDHNMEQGASASEENHGTPDRANSLRRKLNTFHRAIKSEAKATKTRKSAAKGRRRKSLARKFQPDGVIKAKTDVVGNVESELGSRQRLLSPKRK